MKRTCIALEGVYEFPLLCKDTMERTQIPIHRLITERYQSVTGHQFEQCYDALRNTRLTEDISKEDFVDVCTSGGALVRHCQPGETILSSKAQKDTVVVAVTGRVFALHEDFRGNRFIIKSIRAKQALSITVPRSQNSALSYLIQAEEKDTTVLLLNVRKLMRPWPTEKPASTFLKNLMIFMLEAHDATFQHLLDLSKHTTREKLMSFLLNEAMARNTNTFTIKMTRQELADYLCVDRSAISTELGKLKKSGFMDYHDNTFTINSELMRYMQNS